MKKTKLEDAFAESADPYLALSDSIAEQKEASLPKDICLADQLIHTVDIIILHP